MDFGAGGFGNLGGFNGSNENNSSGFGGFDKENFAEKFKNQKNNFTRKKKILTAIIVAILAVIVIAALSIDFIVKIWQVNEVGRVYSDVFWKNFFCKALVSASGFIVSFIISLINIFLIKKLALIKYFNARILKKNWIYVLASFLIALLFGGVMGENSYLELLQALNATEFGTIDPLFSKDNIEANRHCRIALQAYIQNPSKTLYDKSFYR